MKACAAGSRVRASRLGIGTGRSAAAIVLMSPLATTIAPFLRSGKRRAARIANSWMAVAAPIPVERNWVEALSASGSEREDAVADLHDLLLRAARFEIGGRRAAVAPARGGARA